MYTSTNKPKAAFLVEHFQNIVNSINANESNIRNLDDSCTANNPFNINLGASHHRMRPITKNKSSELSCSPVSNTNPIGISFINWPNDNVTNPLGYQIETNKQHQIPYSTSSNSSNSSVTHFSEDSNLSTSPGSSLDSFNSACAEAALMNSCGKYVRRELPSKINQIDLSKYIEKAQQKNTNKTVCCSFCRNNGEPEHIYKSHPLKDIHGRTACPLLKLYKCPICGQTDKNAHTITYCSKYKSSKRSKMLNN
jgi:hypothetical protein